MDAITMTKAEARDWRDGYALEVQSLSRMSRYRLAELDLHELKRQGGQRIYGGPVSKDELITDILELRGYTASRLNEITHILSHEPGQNWPACQWCRGEA